MRYILFTLLAVISFVYSANFLNEYEDIPFPYIHDEHVLHKGNLEQSNSTYKVWISPHSHDDVGWLKTIDEYYYGSR